MERRVPRACQVESMTEGDVSMILASLRGGLLDTARGIQSQERLVRELGKILDPWDVDVFEDLLDFCPDAMSNVTPEKTKATITVYMAVTDLIKGIEARARKRGDATLAARAAFYAVRVNEKKEKFTGNVRDALASQ